MAHFDRLFGILLALQRNKTVSAAQIARQFEVSTRTIYRDLETLSALGVPVYTARGHGGGIRLLEGYFLPPLTFTQGEGIALLLGLTLLQSLRTFPFPAEAQTAMQKLLVAVPEPLRTTLKQAERLIGFEHTPGDVFHPEPAPVTSRSGEPSESQVVTTFLQGILQRTFVRLQYGSPYHRPAQQTAPIIPLGLFWDRNHWYLVGKKEHEQAPLRLWRADRVLLLTSTTESIPTSSSFTIQELLGHNWLQAAMAQWQRNSPVVIRLDKAQAQRLQQDWYYRHARFEECAHNQVYMTFGEDEQELVFELLRWLGPGAELLEPRAWRQQLQAELLRMASIYTSPE